MLELLLVIGRAVTLAVATENAFGPSLRGHILTDVRRALKVFPDVPKAG